MVLTHWVVTESGWRRNLPSCLSLETEFVHAQSNSWYREKCIKPNYYYNLWWSLMDLSLFCFIILFYLAVVFNNYLGNQDHEYEKLKLKARHHSEMVNYHDCRNECLISYAYSIHLRNLTQVYFQNKIPDISFLQAYVYTARKLSWTVYFANNACYTIKKVSVIIYLGNTIYILKRN